MVAAMRQTEREKEKERRTMNTQRRSDDIRNVLYTLGREFFTGARVCSLRGKYVKDQKKIDEKSFFVYTNMYCLLTHKVRCNNAVRYQFCF